ncbi:hypothetical protein PO878_02985 [Iamia majanohamensis]|uniref:Uncharacterized protein n=1 Tax=Iamia majanohamensis TaxID=467976 RepID=A0AAF0BUC1_9ACTN|nr:hypothetical protein [Iamia majanohamensis]WCO67687.1 hypothetical protein PO878_02985 [Iamia majanohamensis]
MGPAGDAVAAGSAAPPAAVARSFPAVGAVPDPVPEGPAGAPPVPPQPPFVATGEGCWEAVLPSAVGRSVTIGVEPGALVLGGRRVALDAISQVRFKVEVGDALLRRAASARMTVAVTCADGSTVRASARNAASARRAEAIVATLGYLWDLLGDTAGARQRDDLLERIDRGGEVQVGALRLTAIGIAWKRRAIVPWSDVGDPEVRELSVVVPTTGEPIVTSLAADDAYMLPSLVPALRRRFG